MLIASPVSSVEIPSPNIAAACRFACQQCRRLPAWPDYAAMMFITGAAAEGQTANKTTPIAWRLRGLRVLGRQGIAVSTQ